MRTFFSSSENFVYFLLFHRVFIYSPYKYLGLYYKHLLRFWFVLSTFHSLWIRVYHILLRSLVSFKKSLSLSLFFFFAPNSSRYSSSVQFSSVAQSYLTLCDPMNRSTPGLPVHHHSRSLLKLISKVFELQLQHQSFQWTPRTDLL